MRFKKKVPKNKVSKGPFYKILSGQIMLSNMLGPDNNRYLDQMLTYKCWPLWVMFSGFGPETTNFIVVLAKRAF